jgi:rhodanese-related sulfurtransferase
MIGDMRITLVFLKPYPATNIRINPAEYEAHFIASQKDDLDSAKVIDVRTPEEFDAGHYSSATNIPLNTISDNINSLNLDKNDLVVVYCRSGSRAGKAKAALLDLGYTNVINAVNQDVVSELLSK